MPGIVLKAIIKHLLSNTILVALFTTTVDP